MERYRSFKRNLSLLKSSQCGGFLNHFCDISGNRVSDQLVISIAARRDGSFDAITYAVCKLRGHSFTAHRLNEVEPPLELFENSPQVEIMCSSRCPLRCVFNVDDLKNYYNEDVSLVCSLIVTKVIILHPCLIELYNILCASNLKEIHIEMKYSLCDEHIHNVSTLINKFCPNLESLRLCGGMFIKYNELLGCERLAALSMCDHVHGTCETESILHENLRTLKLGLFAHYAFAKKCLNLECVSIMNPYNSLDDILLWEADNVKVLTIIYPRSYKIVDQILQKWKNTLIQLVTTEKNLLLDFVVKCSDNCLQQIILVNCALDETETKIFEDHCPQLINLITRHAWYHDLITECFE